MSDTKISITRRNFIKNSAFGAAVLASASALKSPAAPAAKPLRLGGPVFDDFESPDAWIQCLKRLGYRAAYCPVEADEKNDVVNAYTKAAKKADIIIAEVGAWSNPISPKVKVRKAALEKCKKQLDLADRIDANCCVNISGSRNPTDWDGHHKENLTEHTFDYIVETTRAIIDAVKPTRTYYTLEPMPWAYPDSPDSYLRLLKAIDRKHFAVHLDPVNLVCSPQLYYNNARLTRECFKKLGSYIKSCHAKDILLDEKFMTHLDEVRIGLGNFDYKTFLTQLSKMPDIPLMLEHLPDAGQFRLAAEHVRSVAKNTGLTFN
jgi:sugar phosphate isomerase/epimerase